MKTIDAADYAYQNLRKRKLRSWLTILGIVIGVASIITLISIANGVEAQISSRLNLLGNNVIEITPGNTQSTRSGGGFSFPMGGEGGDRSFGEFTRAGAEVEFLPFRGGHEIPMPVLTRLAAFLSA